MSTVTASTVTAGTFYSFSLVDSSDTVIGGNRPGPNDGVISSDDETDFEVPPGKGFHICAGIHCRY